MSGGSSCGGAVNDAYNNADDEEDNIEGKSNMMTMMVVVVMIMMMTVKTMAAEAVVSGGCLVNMCGLLTKYEVMMAGHWPSSFSASSWTETESRSINLQKKNEDKIQPSWANKLGQQRIHCMAFGEMFLAGRTRWVVPSGQDSSIVSSQWCNSS